MPFILRTNDVLEDALAKLAELERASRQEIVRRAVLDRLDRSIHSSRVDYSIQRMTISGREVVERLKTN